MSRPRLCPCGSGSGYDACCARLHQGDASATTAEQLMRSRYSAFVTHDGAYVLRTWHPATRPRSIDFDPQLRWVGLEVLETSAGGSDETRGTVEFRASYVLAGEPGTLHEVSRFVRVGGAWVYVRGRLVEE